MELRDRKRSVDLNKLSVEQAEEISNQLGEKIKQICDKACEEANRLLTIYSMTAKMQIVVQPVEIIQEEKPVEVTKKKRGRPKKQP